VTVVTTLEGMGHAYLTSLVEGACATGKYRSPTSEAAMRALSFLALRARNSMRRHERTFYPCGHCGGYHTTSHVPTGSTIA